MKNKNLKNFFYYIKIDKKILISKLFQIGIGKKLSSMQHPF